MSVLLNLVKQINYRALYRFGFRQAIRSQILFPKNRIVVNCNKNMSRSSMDIYDTLRQQIFCIEDTSTLGSDIVLSEREEQANEIIMEAKREEYEKGFITPSTFNPSQHFFSVLEKINESLLFEYLSFLPKGGVLHAHDLALCSTDFLIELTYRENLWICMTPESEAVALRFAKEKPEDKKDQKCCWHLISDWRKEHGADVLDAYLNKRFSLYPKMKFKDINQVWHEFMKIFILLEGLVLYAPVWGDYYYKALEQFNDDGVQYLEFRTTLPILYDMDGTKYTEMDTVRIYKENLDKFMEDHCEFIGSKLIYAPLRLVDCKGFEKYINICIEIKKEYPDFVAGFDLVGQEELGRPLKDFAPMLLTVPDNIDFYFHAGETNWFGTSVDENLIDAVILGTKRIGHGFAVIKHPMVMQMIKSKDIAIEINPISNQILQLVSDLRNHPCSFYFAHGIPVVISSDDPSFWKASPLSHDFYMAFLGIASAHSDLRLLKKLAMNSLQYSSMNKKQKTVAMRKWEEMWNDYIEEMIKCYST